MNATDRLGQVAPNEIVVKRQVLRDLEAKARGHDVYMRAMNRMRLLAESINRVEGLSYGRGYSMCLTDFARIIAEEDRND